MTGRRLFTHGTAIGLLSTALLVTPLAAGDALRALSLRWNVEMLTIRGGHLPGQSVEALDPDGFCQPTNAQRDWNRTVTPHTTDLVEASPGLQLTQLRSRPSHGVQGKIDLMPADFAMLPARYRRDFPGQERQIGASNVSAPAKKLIEFGWDEPDASFMRLERDQLEQAPFDGCVFHITTRSAAGVPENFTWLCWGHRRFSAAELGPARDDLEAIHWTKFRHNFLRFNVTPADLDWFDDHSAVLNNARLAAEIARAGRCQGILLDTEAYQGKLFDFHGQRDAARRPWIDYVAQARLRGREVMTAFQDGFPDLTVLVTFGHSLLWKQSDGGKKPLSACHDGLLVPFLDGMIEAAHGKTRLVDGHEMSYGYRDQALFAQARNVIKVKAAGLAADPVKYRAVVSAGFGLWLDYDRPVNGWNADKIEGNYFSPDRFASSLRAAVRQADDYVWIYTEKPRWWSKNGKTVDLPPAYIEAARQVRRALLED